MTCATARPSVACATPRSRYSKNERSPRANVASAAWLTQKPCAPTSDPVDDEKIAARGALAQVAQRTVRGRIPPRLRALVVGEREDDDALRRVRPFERLGVAAAG